MFSLEVDDVDVACADLASRVELLNGPMNRPWGIRTASFRDPADYIWEIAHEETGGLGAWGGACAVFNLRRGGYLRQGTKRTAQRVC